VSLVLLMLAGLEGGLRLAGLGDSHALHTSRLKYQQVFLPIMTPSVKGDGAPIYHTTDPRLGSQSILRSKPENGLRIFTFGGSATMGLGFSRNATFSRHLERMLRIAHPERVVEMVNLGIVAFASRQVRLLVEHVAETFSPDLLIVYSGNNEFLEIHAEKYAEANRTLLSATLEYLGATNLYRFVTRIARGGQEVRSIASWTFSNDDLRLSENQIIRDIELTPQEIEKILDGYESNLVAMVAAAQRARTPIMLLTVAGNWEWRGREDLPADWVDELVGEEESVDAGRYARVVEILDARLAEAGPSERYEILFKRAVARQELGDFGGARDDFRASMSADPHLRRALDAANDRVRAVAERNGTSFLDVIDALAAAHQHGIVGFDDLYDYVHFTPDGAVRVAGAIFREIERDALLPSAGSFDPAAYERKWLLAFAALSEDFLSVDDWIGIGFDPARMADRDLWKFDHMLDELDERAAAEPGNARALAYRANAAAQRIDGAEDALRDYRAALEIREDEVIRRNLEKLEREHAR
jgi:tetratricopeptide (TPR) repeat protein